MNSVTVTTPSKKYYVHTGAELLTCAGELTAPLEKAFAQYRPGDGSQEGSGRS